MAKRKSEKQFRAECRKAMKVLEEEYWASSPIKNLVNVFFALAVTSVGISIMADALRE